MGGTFVLVQYAVKTAPLEMNIIVAGRDDVEAGLIVETPYVVISISDPDSRRPRIKRGAGFRGVLYLQFHDAEPLPDTRSDKRVLMTKADARRIWNFVLQHWDDIGTLVIHCEQGASRSPAVATGIASVMQVSVDEVLRWSQPNQFVVRLVREMGEAIVTSRRDK